jgi:large subunit ribosomal protein L21
MTEEKKTTPAKKAASSKVEKAEKPVSNGAEKFAVIKTGGKQYVVIEGLYFNVEKLDAEEGKEVTFNEVLLVADGGNVKVGTPFVDGAKVTAKVLKQFQDKKVLVFKYKPKKRERKSYGHRQELTQIQITKIA